MSWKWYGYYELLRKASTASLDCLESMVCVCVSGWANVRRRQNGLAGANFDSPNYDFGDCRVAVNANLIYKLIPLANSNGVYIRGDKLKGPGEFYSLDVLRDGNGNDIPGIYWIQIRSQYEHPANNPINYVDAYGCGSRYAQLKVKNYPEHSRLTYDPETRTATLDMRLYPNDVKSLFSQSVINGYFSDGLGSYRADFPAQSVSLRDLEVEAPVGLIGSHQFGGGDETWGLTDYPNKTTYDPLTAPFFTIPFRRSNS